MITFVNPSRSSYINDVIANLSDENKLVASGSAKAFIKDNPLWLADFLYKYADNTAFNPHISYLSFFSDKEIVYQEFGNVVETYAAYPLFTNYMRSKFGTSTFEMTKKQYDLVSSRRGGYDIIEYINMSDAQKFDRSSSDTSFTYNHNFWRAPVFAISGYKIHLDNASVSHPTLGLAQNYDRYYFAYPWSDATTVAVDSVMVDVLANGVDFHAPNTGMDEMNSYVVGSSISDVKRIFDVKINIADPKFFYFDTSREWVCYYNESQHYSDLKYQPYYGFVNFYQNSSTNQAEWTGIHPLNQQLYTSDDKVLFFPAILKRNIFEPAKIIVDWGKKLVPPIYVDNPVAGQMTYHSAVHGNETGDQSRIVYNICGEMFTSMSGAPLTEPFNASAAESVLFRNPDGNYLFCGIDVDTERNRRYSGVVMTEPYMVTEPLRRGELVDYMFIFEDETPVGLKFDFDTTYPGSGWMYFNVYLKLKASKDMIAEIDRELQKEECNTDIIETLSFKDPFNGTDEIVIPANIGKLNHDAAHYYKNFGTTDNSAIDVFFRRQNDCIDDLIGSSTGKLGIVGQGAHVPFVINKFGTPESNLYDTKLKVNGLGFVSKLIRKPCPSESITYAWYVGDVFLSNEATPTVNLLDHIDKMITPPTGNPYFPLTLVTTICGESSVKNINLEIIYVSVGGYLAAGDGFVLYSSDMVSWYYETIGANIYTIHESSLFLGGYDNVNIGAAIYKRDGSTWRRVYTGDNGVVIKSIASGNGILVAAGGNASNGYNGLILVSSDDGETWTVRASSSPYQCATRVRYFPSNNTWIVLMQQTVPSTGTYFAYSTNNGYTWQTQAVSLTLQSDLVDALYDGTRYCLLDASSRAWTSVVMTGNAATWVYGTFSGTYTSGYTSMLSDGSNYTITNGGSTDASRYIMHTTSIVPPITATNVKVISDAAKLYGDFNAQAFSAGTHLLAGVLKDDSINVNFFPAVYKSTDLSTWTMACLINTLPNSQTRCIEHIQNLVIPSGLTHTEDVIPVQSLDSEFSWEDIIPPLSANFTLDGSSTGPITNSTWPGSNTLANTSTGAYTKAQWVMAQTDVSRPTTYQIDIEGDNSGTWTSGSISVSIFGNTVTQDFDTSISQSIDELFTKILAMPGIDSVVGTGSSRNIYMLKDAGFPYIDIDYTAVVGTYRLALVYCHIDNSASHVVSGISMTGYYDVFLKVTNVEDNTDIKMVEGMLIQNAPLS